MMPSKFSCHFLQTAIAAIALGSAGFACAQYAAPDKSSGNKNRQEIIKSVDAQGRVIYSNRMIEGTRQVEVMRSRVFQSTAQPPAAETASSKASSGASGSTASSSSTSSGGAAATGKAPGSADLSIKALNEANTLIAKANCTNAKQSLASLSSGPRLVRTTPEGKREEMTASQIEADKARAQDIIAKDCV